MCEVIFISNPTYFRLDLVELRLSLKDFQHLLKHFGLLFAVDVASQYIVFFKPYFFLLGTTEISTSFCESVCVCETDLCVFHLPLVYFSCLKSTEQAGPEQGQAQLKLELKLNFTK